MHESADLQHESSAHPPARVHHALTTRLALDILHGHGLDSGSTVVRQWLDSGSTVAAKAGADAPGGGISLCFCRRGCAAPAQKAATLNALPPRNYPSPRKEPPPRSTGSLANDNSRHAQRTAAKTFRSRGNTIIPRDRADKDGEEP